MILHNLPQHQKTYHRTYALSEDLDQPEPLPRLISIFTRHVLDRQGCKVSSCGQQRLGSACVDAQSDLSLHGIHMVSEGSFSHLAAPM